VTKNDKTDTSAVHFGISSPAPWVYAAAGSAAGRFTGGRHAGELKTVVANLADL
jgi:hypothetical protein